MTPKQALLIATIAHGAVGQTRESGVPYIVHPIRVKLLTATFMRRYWKNCIYPALFCPDVERYFEPSKESLDAMFVAAYLHDTLEDTKLTREHLLDAGISYTALDYVERLTKPDPHGPTPLSYYQGISESVPALVIKAADRCANLDDAFKDLFKVGKDLQVKRWRNYVNDTYEHVLPMYVTLPKLRAEIQWRADRIVAYYPTAKTRREAYIARIHKYNEERKSWKVLEGQAREKKPRRGYAA